MPLRIQGDSAGANASEAWEGATPKHMDHQKHDPHQEQDPGDLSGDRSHPDEAKGARNQSHEQEDQRIVDHFRTSLGQPGYENAPVS